MMEDIDMTVGDDIEEEFPEIIAEDAGEDIDKKRNDEKENNSVQIIVQEKSDVLSRVTPIESDVLEKLIRSFDPPPSKQEPINPFEVDISWRLTVVHIRGVQDMSSNDVLDYFKSFEPTQIEWVNDMSCNVVFESQSIAASAIMDLSVAVVWKGKKFKIDEDSSGLDIIDGDSLEISIPPGIWRLCKENLKAKVLLLRFANEDDHKMKGARKFSEYYQKYGFPENEVTAQQRYPEGITSRSKMLAQREKDDPQPHTLTPNERYPGGIISRSKLLAQREKQDCELNTPTISTAITRTIELSPEGITTRGRILSERGNDDEVDDDFGNGRTVRMRMRADDEEKKTKPLKPMITVLIDRDAAGIVDRKNNTRNTSSIFSRLNRQENTSVWDRLENTNSEHGTGNDLRSRLKRNRNERLNKGRPY